MYCRRLMALAFLPSDFIIPQFEAIRDEIPRNSPLQPLLEYFYSQWIQNPIFAVSSWCIYMQPTQTNNDCEGWHNRLSSKAGRQQNLNLYKLIHLLNNEVKDVSLRSSAKYSAPLTCPPLPKLTKPNQTDLTLPNLINLTYLT